MTAPHLLPHCTHSPAADWSHGSIASLVNSLTGRIYGLTGFCRTCRRTVKYILPADGVTGLQPRVRGEGAEHLPDRDRDVSKVAHGTQHEER